MQLISVTQNDKKLIMYILKIYIYVKLFAFHFFLDMQRKHSFPIGHWKRLFFNLSSVMFMFLSSVADKQCFSGGITSSCAPYFHPTLPSGVPTLKSNRVVKQSLKQPLCNYWLFYFALWFRCRVIMALPSAHPVVLQIVFFCYWLKKNAFREHAAVCAWHTFALAPSTTER